MRKTLGSTAVLVAAAMALSACGKQTSQAQAAGGESQGELVTAEGCPTTPKADCVAITTNGTTYDITSAKIDLAGGHSVTITGTAAGVAGACGQKLTNVQVEYNTLKCGAPIPPAAVTPPAAK
jgi:hypothetical protein